MTRSKQDIKASVQRFNLIRSLKADYSKKQSF